MGRKCSSAGPHRIMTGSGSTRLCKWTKSVHTLLWQVLGQVSPFKLARNNYNMGASSSSLASADYTYIVPDSEDASAGTILDSGVSSAPDVIRVCVCWQALAQFTATLMSTKTRASAWRGCCLDLLRFHTDGRCHTTVALLRA